MSVLCLYKVQLKGEDDSLKLDVQQEQSEEILRMQEGNEALEELVSETVIYSCSCEPKLMHILN